MAFDPSHFDWLNPTYKNNPGSYEDDILDRRPSRRAFRPHKPSEEVAKLLAEQE